MDQIDSKLLIVTENGKYFSLLSIGDIQRAIIKNANLNDPIEGILRKEVVVANVKNTFEEIKAEIIKHRAEYMPVIDDENNLVKLYFWNDVIGERSDELKGQLSNIPVVIMAGGKGTRLKPLTNIIPKALVPIVEKPIVEVIIDRFANLGVSEVYLTVNHKSEMIEQYFESVKNKKYSIAYIKEDKPLGTAGSLHLLKDKLKSTFFVSNCDILIDQDYREVYNYHKTNENSLTIVAALKHYDIPYGTLETKEGGILEHIEEKPELTFLVNSGMYILEAETLDYIPENEFFHITHLIDKLREENLRVGVFPVSEKSWLDIGNWSEYNKTQEIFKQKFS
ncbi:MAG: NTP transferase domain-containing protein [Chitinophagales bacterium]|nr:NTP transferase domain-containing protein [Chitinophagales bacterium]